MKVVTTALVAVCLGLGLLAGSASASPRHHHHHHRVRHHRSGYYVQGVRHTHPRNDADKASRSFNHEMNNASKSINHAFQGKKPTPKGYK